MSKHPLCRTAFRLALLFCCLAFGAGHALAQSQASTGQISGVVSDTAGALVQNATVKVVNTQTGLERTVTTSDEGLYQVVLLPSGTYNVTAEASGFQPVTVEGAQVTVGGTTDVNLTLGAGGVQESVTVTSEAVETTRPEADAVVNQELIDNLPINGRRFQDFVTLTPTAQVDPSRGQISLSGQRGINANINIDGVDYNQPFFGGIRGGERSNNAFTIPQESIQEFQVVPAGYTAEFGRSTGGLVNAVTKSGTNDIHGSLFYLVRPKRLAARNAFGQQAAPTQHQVGGSVGGPIVENRWFYFGSAEVQRVKNPRAVLFDRLVGFTPNANGTEAFNFFRNQEEPFQQTNDAHAFLIRTDYQVSDAHRFNLRYNHSKNEALNANATGNALQPTTTSALSNNGTEQDRTHTFVGQMTNILSANVVNEFRGQFAYEQRPRLANVEQTTVESNIGNIGTVSFLPNSQSDKRIQLADNVTWTNGNHTFKFGGEFNHVSAEQTFGFDQFGRFIISGAFGGNSGLNTLLDILSAGGAINRFDQPSNVVRYQKQIGNLQVAIESDELAFFAQDSWRIRPNFTLQLGLRWEGQYNSQPDASNTALVNLVSNRTFPIGYSNIDPGFIPDSANQWAPRVGFAWDPFSDSRTVVRGFAGLYYARTPLLLFSDPIGTFRTPPGNLSVTLPFAIPAANPNASCNTVYCQFLRIGIDLNTRSLDQLPNLTPEQLNQIASSLGLSVDPNRGAQPQFIAGDFRNPKSAQAGLGVEHEIFDGVVVGADFTYVNTVYLQRNRDINLPAPIVRATDPAQRPFFGLNSGRSRPIPSLGQVQVRESTARSLYRSLTLRTVVRRNWGIINAFYTLSKSLSDDDNERSSGGSSLENVFDLRPEYSDSDLDRRHQFVASPLFYLPYDFEFSSAIRLRTGRPIDATFGSDVNQSGGFGRDRPFSAPGVPFQRNAFRNLGSKDVDVRLQKRFSFGESVRLILSAEVFNIFGIDNIELSGTPVTNFCATTNDARCGLDGATNVNFLQVRDQNPASARFGDFLLNNNAGAPRQIQFGARFQF
ncbi:MAG: TonB-dependent receptor [Acidobacteriota bacterium]|nr:TonB-dependent receptor [Acidobacteriota bacterium]